VQLGQGEHRSSIQARPKRPHRETIQREAILVKPTLAEQILVKRTPAKRIMAKSIPASQTIGKTNLTKTIPTETTRAAARLPGRRPAKRSAEIGCGQASRRFVAAALPRSIVIS
jgi:hypothetical protein